MLMVGQGDEEALMENLRCTRARREKKTPEGWLEVVFTGLASCQQCCSYTERSRFKRSRKNCQKMGSVRAGMAIDCAKSCLRHTGR